MAKKARKAAKKRGVATNLEQVARHFKAGTRTVGTWRAAGMPGKAGAWDLVKIREWLRSNELGPYRQDSATASTGQQLVREEIERAKLARIQGRLIDVHEAIGIYQGFVSEARAILEQLPDQVAAALPESTAGEDRRRAREDAARLVRGALMALADGLTAYRSVQES